MLEKRWVEGWGRGGESGQLTEPEPGVVASLSEPGLTADLVAGDVVMPRVAEEVRTRGVRRATIVRSEDSIAFISLVRLMLVLPLTPA